MKNVVADPRYKEIADALRDQLMDELAVTNDPRLIKDGKFFETPPMAGSPGKAQPGNKKK